MARFFKRRRIFVVDEKNLTTVLRIINSHRKSYKLYVGSFLEETESEKWFIRFKVSDRKYGRIMEDLLSIGTFKLEVRSNGLVDYYFEKSS